MGQLSADQNSSDMKQLWQKAACAVGCRFGAFRNELWTLTTLLAWRLQVLSNRLALSSVACDAQQPHAASFSPTQAATNSRAACVLAGIAFLEWRLATLLWDRVGHSVFERLGSHAIISDVAPCVVGQHHASRFHRICENVIT